MSAQAEALEEIAASVRALPGEYRYRRLPWWKVLLKRRRYERYWYTYSVFESLLQRRQIPEGFDWVEFPRLKSL